MGIYLDYAAATPLDDGVRAAMLPFLESRFANPSALYSDAQEVKRAIEEARSVTAHTLNVQPAEIIFTSGGTESNNLIIFGIAEAQKRGHIIITAIEHESVLEPCRELEKRGYLVTYLPVNAEGFVSESSLKHALTPETILVSIHYANNEIGTIQNIPRLAETVHTNSKTIFHIDACQAGSYLSLNAKKLCVDALTLNGSKIYGPKGSGALFLRQGVTLVPRFFGGGQEKSKRSGTENVAGIIGFSQALKIAQETRNEESARLNKLRDVIIDFVIHQIPRTRLNGPRHHRLSNNINCSIDGVLSEDLLMACDERKIAVAAGSACTSGSQDPSHVLLALGLDEFTARTAVRITLGRFTTEQEIEKFLPMLSEIIQKLRAESAFW